MAKIRLGHEQEELELMNLLDASAVEELEELQRAIADEIVEEAEELQEEAQLEADRLKEAFLKQTELDDMTVEEMKAVQLSRVGKRLAKRKADAEKKMRAKQAE